MNTWKLGQEGDAVDDWEQYEEVLAGPYLRLARFWTGPAFEEEDPTALRRGGRCRRGLAGSSLIRLSAQERLKDWCAIKVGETGRV